MIINLIAGDSKTSVVYGDGTMGFEQIESHLIQTFTEKVKK